METITRVPVTLNERLEFGPELRIPATWDEFIELLEECEYRIEYDEGEIISFMGYASEEHETLVGRIISLLDHLLTAESFRVGGSNLALHIPGFVRRYYNADCVVLHGSSEKILLKGNMSAVANPILIAEVLSPANREYDLNHKFKNYTKIPSLQQMLFIESTEHKVYSHLRRDGWAPQIHLGAGASFPVLDEGYIELDELYRKVKL